MVLVCTLRMKKKNLSNDASNMIEEMIQDATLARISAGFVVDELSDNILLMVDNKINVDMETEGR